jgi:hypothetical protein
MGLPAHPVDSSYSVVGDRSFKSNGITHASIIPLIGGMTLAQMEANGSPPEYS